METALTVHVPKPCYVLFIHNLLCKESVGLWLGLGSRVSFLTKPCAFD